MDAAVKQAGGNAQNREAVIAALKKANYASTRGTFKYANNHYPIENFYLRVIGKDGSGRIANKVIGTVLTNYQDTTAAQCAMKPS
jgi:branched-chain amino acid transport system substrate-binding protein